MKRRSFLKYTGSACTSAFLGSNVSLAGSQRFSRRGKAVCSLRWSGHNARALGYLMVAVGVFKAAS